MTADNEKNIQILIKKYSEIQNELIKLKQEQIQLKEQLKGKVDKKELIDTEERLEKKITEISNQSEKYFNIIIELQNKTIEKQDNNNEKLFKTLIKIAVALSTVGVIHFLGSNANLIKDFLELFGLFL